MRPLTKRKALNINEGFQVLRFPGCGVGGLQAVTLFLLLGLSTAALGVNSLEAQENLQSKELDAQKEVPGAVLAPTAEGENQKSEGLSGSLFEGAKTQRADLSFGASVSLGLESNAYVWGSRDHVTTSTAAGGVSLGIDSITFTTRLAASRMNKEYEEWEWAEDLQMGLSHKPWKMTRTLDLGVGINVILPMTDYSRKYSLLEQGAGARASLIWNLNRTVRGLKVTPAVRVTNYQYATPVAFDKRSNEEWRLNTRLTADYEIVKTLSLSALFGRTWAWTVNGNPLDRFETEQSITWQPYELTSLTLGHSRGGNALRSDGTNNVALYDEGDASTFYLELGLEI